jgi:low affinity Fe/Cu permease
VTKPEAHRNPSEIDRQRGWFDELASRAQDVVSRDIFFLALVVLTIAWLPSYFLLKSVDHWHLAFLIPAEIVTLFIVALLANHDRRSEQALHRKVDAIAAALAEIVEDSQSTEVRSHATELRAADGLEDRESTDDS